MNSSAYPQSIAARLKIDLAVIDGVLQIVITVAEPAS
jgi:hypothetical protein